MTTPHNVMAALAGGRHWNQLPNPAAGGTIALEPDSGFAVLGVNDTAAAGTYYLPRPDFAGQLLLIYMRNIDNGSLMTISTVNHGNNPLVTGDASSTTVKLNAIGEGILCIGHESDASGTTTLQWAAIDFGGADFT